MGSHTVKQLSRLASFLYSSSVSSSTSSWYLPAFCWSLTISVLDDPSCGLTRQCILCCCEEDLWSFPTFYCFYSDCFCVIPEEGFLSRRYSSGTHIKMVYLYFSLTAFSLSFTCLSQLFKLSSNICLLHFLFRRGRRRRCGRIPPSKSKKTSSKAMKLKASRGADHTKP